MESQDTSQTSKSHFHKAVGLDDWWLIEAENDLEGRRLAVGGLSIKHGAARLFSSAPIIKRINPFCLETADDITVNLGSFINKSRTTENGFSHEVSGHFQYGFPPYWEEYTEKYFAEHSTGSVSAFDKLAVDSGTQNSSYKVNVAAPEEPEGIQDPEVVVNSYEFNITAPKEPEGTQDAELEGTKDTESVVDSFNEASRGVCNYLSSICLNGTQNESLSTTPVGGNPKLAVSSKGDMDIGTVTPSENGSRSTRASSRSRKDSWKKKPSSKAVENPHEEKLKGSSTQVNISTAERDNNAEVAATPRNKAKRKLPYNPYASPLTRERMKKDSILSPDSFKRSRAGRILLPKLAFWRNQIAIYDIDGGVSVVLVGDGEESSGGSKSEDRKVNMKKG